jgi:hypothetical protein
MENISTIVSIIALIVSVLAYQNANNKLRLDLFEARWEIYERILKFCSTVSQLYGLPQSNNTDRDQKVIHALISANESFYGLGYHRIKALFGNDIQELGEELVDIYSYFKTLDRSDSGNECHQRIKRVYEICNLLPDKFKPYVYFGDIKAPK